MNRCKPSHPGRRRTLRLLAGILATAFVRASVAAAVATERGILQILNAPEVLFNGRSERLAPGARIRAPGGLVVMPATLVGKTLQVQVARELHGLLHEIWILGEVAPPSTVERTP